jgi:hypothetical protein
MASASSSSSAVKGIVYCNNRPSPAAKVLMDVKMDVGMRFSVSPQDVLLVDSKGRLVPDSELVDTPIETAAMDTEPMRVRIRQKNGEMTEYEVVMELADELIAALQAGSGAGMGMGMGMGTGLGAGMAATTTTSLADSGAAAGLMMAEEEEEDI